MGPRSLRGLSLGLPAFLLWAWGAQDAGAVNKLCFEKLSNSNPLYFQEHPGRSRAVLGTQDGLMRLVTLPPVGSRTPMKVVSTWLDLTGRVLLGDETGLLSFAFHPNFARNGRFFASYTCDANKHLDCKSPCGCNSKVGCTVGQKGAGCSSTTIVSEYNVGPHPLRSTRVRPQEVRRVLGFARPYSNHNGGQIFFGADGFLYFTSGDGGNQGDPWDLAQNPQALFGKVLRLNVDRFERGYNFSIPPGNPFRGRGHPLVFALGLRNPWRCDEDPITHMIACGDVGASAVEEIDVIGGGRNYMWHNFEGSQYRTGESDPKKLVGTATYPVFSYTHDSLGGLGCVIGGVFYRAGINRCLAGKYLYADHSGPMWVSTIAAGRSSTSRVSFTCAPSSPIRCPAGGDGSNTEWAEVLSWGRDIAGNAYLLTNSGVYRVTRLPACGIRC